MRFTSILLASCAVLTLSGCAKKEAVVAGKWGYIDKQGQFIILPQFDSASEISDKGALVFTNKHLMRLDPETKQESKIPVGPEDKAELPPLPEVRAAEAGTDTYKILEGEAVIFDPADKERELPSIFPEKGSACVRFGDKFAFIGPDGKLSGAIFDEARPYQEGRAAVKQNGKWGFINKKGVMVIPPHYLDAGSFSHGLAPVKQKSEEEK